VTVERRVIMLSRGGRLATFALQALGNGTSVACLDSPADLVDWARPSVELVLLDLPRHRRGIAYRQLRQRYRGPVLAFLDPDDDGGGLPPDRGPLAILVRPFSGEDLSDALTELLAPSGELDASTTTAAATGAPPASDLDPAAAAPLALAAPEAPAAAGRSRWRSLRRRG
jgi:hypothetical protein